MDIVDACDLFLVSVDRSGFAGCDGVDFVDRGDLSTGVLLLPLPVLPKIFNISAFISFIFLQSYGKYF
ncbi:MAG: hypothetical protein LBS54_08865 [Dysgonamonadaceae bacterium]|nr:hypothetical protein [Dysgonamonadaceae bacterium]